MKTLVSLFIASFAITHLFAQHLVTGTLLDQRDEPVVAAVLTLYSADTLSFAKIEISSEDGRFKFSNLAPDTYHVRISALGFIDRQLDSIQLRASDTDIGVVRLSPDSEMLEEVLVKAEKPMIQVLADKTVFNVQHTIGAAGLSGFELLRKAPGVIVDNNENLIVEGKTGVLIYIDGKPSVLRGEDLVNYVKSLQANDIEAIEIITQPTSKYDAEGNAGIINIRLKRDISLGTNGRLTSGLTIGKFARVNSGLSFNTRNKRLNIYGTLSNRFGKSFSFINLYRTQGDMIFDAKTETIYDNDQNNIRIGADYTLDKKSTIGVLVTGNFSKRVSEADSRTVIYSPNNTEPSRVLIAGSDAYARTSNLFLNANYRLQADDKSSVNVDVDYGLFRRDRENVQPNRYFNGKETELLQEVANYMVTPIDIDLFTAKVDYESPMMEGQLGLGVKFSQVVTNNAFDFYDRVDGENILITERSNDFSYDERVAALYANYGKRYEKWSYQLGLRMEHTRSTGNLLSSQVNTDERVERSYVDWFPSAGINYQLNPKHAIALNYSRRIQRPNYQSLNPFEFKIDELSYRKGNPFLQPQYTENVKLSHTFNYRLTTSLSYSFISDYSAQVTEAVGAEKNFIIQRNVANQRIVNLGFSYPTQINKWWGIYVSVNAFRSTYEATTADFNNLSQNTFSLYAQNSITLSKGFSAELSGWYSSPSVWGGTYETKSLGSLNLALQKRLIGDRLTIRLALNDILYTAPWEGDMAYGALHIAGEGGSDSRQFQCNVTYRFGRKEIKKARKRKAGLEDERKRIN